MSSKARLVITAVVVEKQPVAQVVRDYGVSRSWVYELVARYRAEGVAAFEPRSRRPRTSPVATSPRTVELVLALRKRLGEQGLDAGADTIAWHLAHHHDTRLSRATIHRILTRHAEIVPDPSKRPRSSYVRFEATQPNECWQSDFTHYRLAGGTGPGGDVEIITWLDDHSRYALHLSAHRRVTAAIVAATFGDTAAQHGFPAATLTDNGMVYTVRLASRPRWTHRPGTRTTPPRHRPEEQPTEPPHHLRQGRAFPADPQELAARTTPAPDHDRRTPSPARGVRRDLQPAAAPPLPAPPGHSRHRLHRPPQSRSRRRPRRRHPPPRPHRQDRQIGDGHPARRRASTPHRSRTTPRRNPRPAARPRPPRARHQRRHRRTPTRTGNRHHPRLPAPTPTEPEITNARTHTTWVRASGMS